MRIREIRPFDQKRSEVLTDGELRFVLYNREVAQFGLKEDGDLSEETAKTILTEVLLKRAKLRAMNLLKSRDYTEARLRKKLSEGGYPQEVIDGAIAYVRGYHYVDDARYARDFIRCHMERNSKRQIEAALLERGIDRQVLADALEEAYADELCAGQDPEVLQVRRLMEKRRFDPAAASADDMRRFIAAAARRGFSMETIRSAMREDG